MRYYSLKSITDDVIVYGAYKIPEQFKDTYTGFYAAYFYTAYPGVDQKETFTYRPWDTQDHWYFNVKKGKFQPAGWTTRDADYHSYNHVVTEELEVVEKRTYDLNELRIERVQVTW